MIVSTTTDVPDSLSKVLTDKTVQLKDGDGNDIVSKDNENNAANEADTEKVDATDKSTEDSATSGKNTEQPKKVDKSVQRRIDELISKNAELERKLESVINSKSDEQKSNDKSDKDKSDDEPSADDYDTQAEYMKALSKWAAKQARDEERAEREKEATANRTKEIVKAWNTQVTAAKSKYDDWDDVMGDLEIGVAVGRALVETPDGAEIAYFIGKNPKEADSLRDLKTDREVGMAIGELRSKMRVEAKQRENDNAKDKLTNEAKKKPEPLNPVAGTSNSAVTKMPSEMTYAEYKVYRNNQIAARLKKSN